jgi:hypothetical protein
VELDYRTPAPSRDPARFAFAHGCKDGAPFPVGRETYDRMIESSNVALEASGVDRRKRGPTPRSPCRRCYFTRSQRP